MKMTWIHLFVYGLACFRLAVLISQDSGPGHLLLKFRSLLKREARKHPAVRKTYVQEGVECLRCSSLWVAAPVAAYAIARGRLPEWLTIAGDLLLLAMALSALAILLNRVPPAGF